MQRQIVKGKTGRHYVHHILLVNVADFYFVMHTYTFVLNNKEIQYTYLSTLCAHVPEYAKLMQYTSIIISFSIGILFAIFLFYTKKDHSSSAMDIPKMGWPPTNLCSANNTIMTIAIRSRRW